MGSENVGFIEGSLCVIVFAVLGCGLVTLTSTHRPTLSFQMRLFLGALFARFVLSVVIYQFGLVSVMKDEDASGWVIGASFANQWNEHGLAIWQLAPVIFQGAANGHHMGFYYLLGVFFYLTGAMTRLSAAALNCFFGAFTAVLTYRVTRCLFSEWVSTRVGGCTAFLPSMLIWSAMTVKEPVVIMLESLALYACIRLQQRGPVPRYLFLCVGMIAALYPFRFYASYLVALATVVALLAPVLARPGRAATGVLLLVLGLPLLGMTGSFAKAETQLESFDLEKAQAFRANVSKGGSAAGAGSGVQTGDIRTPTGLVLGLSVGAAHLLLAPFPWEMGSGSVRMLLTLPELLVWWWMVFYGLYPGFRFAVKHRMKDILVILIFIGAFGFLYSLLFGNVGLIFRQRAQLLPWLLILVWVGLEQRAIRRLRSDQLRMKRFEESLPPPRRAVHGAS